MDTHVTKHIMVRKTMSREDAKEEMRDMRRAAGMSDEDVAFYSASKEMSDDEDAGDGDNDDDNDDDDNAELEAAMGLPRSNVKGDDLLRRLDRMTEVERDVLQRERVNGTIQQTLYEGISIALRDQDVLRKAEHGENLTADERQRQRSLGDRRSRERRVADKKKLHSIVDDRRGGTA
jgi:hypothetical protein